MKFKLFLENSKSNLERDEARRVKSTKFIVCPQGNYSPQVIEVMKYIFL